MAKGGKRYLPVFLTNIEANFLNLTVGDRPVVGALKTFSPLFPFVPEDKFSSSRNSDEKTSRHR